MSCPQFPIIRIPNEKDGLDKILGISLWWIDSIEELGNSFAFAMFLMVPCKVDLSSSLLDTN